MDEMVKDPLCALPAAATIRGTHSGRPATGPNAVAASNDRDRLEKACGDFEAIFVQQLFKTMRASVPESGLFGGGRAEEIYTSMLDQQVAEQMAYGQSGIGLANQMRNKLAPYAITEPVIKTRY
jgi:flagellar protein FlgJ